MSSESPQKLATPPATPPPIYRAVSPPPPAYKAAKKAYLTVEDLYIRYAPLRALRPVRQSAHQSACSKAIPVSSYLTIYDLFRRFSKRTSAKSGPAADKPASKSSATSTSRQQCKQSDTKLNRIQASSPRTKICVRPGNIGNRLRSVQKVEYQDIRYLLSASGPKISNSDAQDQLSLNFLPLANSLTAFPEDTFQASEGPAYYNLAAVIPY